MKWPLLCLFLTLATRASAQTYFQQRVDTRIDVQLDDQRHYLHGFEEFTYTNQSPDTLRYIYLHLWPNAYLHDRTVFTEQQTTNRKSAFYYSKPQDRGFIDSLDMAVNGLKVSPYSMDHTPDIARVDLPEALPPGGSFTFTTPFRVKIPLVFSRLGHMKQAYYISQWFAKPAVYDRTGWHAMPYTDQGEFYSEIGSYDVKITLPENYVVMATGNCLTESENQWMDSLAAVSYSDMSRFRLFTRRMRDSVNRIPKSAARYKTLHFHEDNVHDFAWFADKRFIVRKDTFSVTGRPDPVTAYAAFLPSSKYAWRNATGNIREAVQQLSHEVGTYPYQTVKAVEGDMKAGGGMEYPTITVIDRSMDANTLQEVIVHEVGHNWFYGMLASNERDMPWMDEGINSFYEHKIMNHKRADSTGLQKGEVSIKGDDLVYYQGVASGTDQAVTLNAAMYTDYNYGADVYMKTSLLMNWLEGYMGKDNFRNAMHEYFDTWRYRHPAPADFEAIMQRHTDKPLDWFFRQAMTDDRTVDFAIRKVHTDNDSVRIRVKNRSAYAAPVHINAWQGDTLVNDFWTAPFKRSETIALAPHDATSWTIGDELPDFKKTNNRYNKKGLLHGRGIKPGIGFGLGRGYKEQVLLLPALGYNVYNGFMGGLLIHNLSIPDKKFRFALAPVYGFGSRDFAGAGSLGYFIHPRSHTFREIAFQADLRRFGYDKTDYNTPEMLYANYLKIAPSVTFTFKNRTAISPVTRTLLLKGYAIRENYFDYQKTAPDTIYRPQIAHQQNYYGLVRYTHQNNRLYNPFSYVGEVQLGKDFAKLSLEGNARIDYNAKGKSLYLRGFAGKFISINNEPFATDRYYLNTTYNGANDYLYDETYFGRNEREGLAYRQVSTKEGGFKIPTAFYANPLGRSDDWLASLNIKTDLPLGRLPIRLYLDIATFSNAKRINPSGDAFLYEAGAEIHLFRDILRVHLPLILSKDYKDYLTNIYGDKRFQNSITFTLQLQKINWLRFTQGGLKQLM